MKAGADLLSFLLSSSGLVAFLLISAGWLLAQPRGRAPRRLLAGVALFYACASLAPIPWTITSLLIRGFHPLVRADVPEGRSVVVVLGSGGRTVENWSGDRLSTLDPVGAERVLEAFRVFRLVDATWVLTSGGQVRVGDTDDPAGLVMKEALLSRGVPASRIVIETESRNTREEAQVIQEMLPGLAVDHVIVVTSATHMRRSLAAFRALGIEAIPAITQDSSRRPGGIGWLVPSAGALDQSNIVAHELLGLVYYRLRGWAR